MGIASATFVPRLFLYVFLAFSCLAPLRAATLERLSLDDLIEKSTAIVRGRVTGSHAAFRGNTIYTHYRVEVTQRWKGPAEQSAEFLVPGGTVGRVKQTCSGAPELKQGQEYLLFLWTSSHGATYITGFTQGLFELGGAGSERMALRQAATDLMLEPGTGRVVGGERIEMRLRDLGTRISTNLAKGGTR